MITLAVLAYAVAMIAANLLVAQFGPAITPINSFLLIGFDLTMRDVLHVRLRPWQMLAVIVGAGVLSWVLNPAAQQIAIASAVAFMVSAMVDWLVFSRLKGSWMRRSMFSNVLTSCYPSVGS